MDANYVFLCGMVWSQFGKEDAGLELIRALNSPYLEVRVLARAMLEVAKRGSRELLGQAIAQDEISADQASMCGFDDEAAAPLNHFQPGAWFRPASA